MSSTSGTSSPRPTSATGGTPTGRSPTTSRRWRRRRPTCSGSRRRGRGRSVEVGDTEHDLLHPERLQAVRLRAGLRGDRATTTARHAARGEQHRVPLQLGDGGRAERGPHHEPDGQRRGHRDHEPDARATPPTQKWERIRDGLSRFAGRELERERGRLHVRVGHQPAQPGHRPPAGELRPALLRSRRGHRRLHPAVLARRDRPRPRGDGRHPRQRRGQPGHRRAGDRRPACAAGCSR